jgi:predicted phage tail protein
MPNIAGIFDNAPLANQAIADLLSAGLTKDDISLVMSDKAKHHFSAATKDTGDRTLVDTAIGAGTGGVLGALLAGLTTISAIVIPGAAASVLVVGPIIAMLTGGGAGAAVGGLAGALSALGISAAENHKYEDELKAGKAVIVAHTKNDAQTMAARTILFNKGAEIRAA